jgi:uncharacterized protein YecT (DUF1311 family)
MDEILMIRPERRARMPGKTACVHLQKKTLVKVLSPGKVLTRTDLAEKELNDKYPELQALLEPSARSNLRLEEIEWLKKRDSIGDPRQKLEFTEARVAKLENRIAALKE